MNNLDTQIVDQAPELVPIDLPLFYRVFDSWMGPWAKHGKCACCKQPFEYCYCLVHEGLEVRG